MLEFERTYNILHAINNFLNYIRQTSWGTKVCVLHTCARFFREERGGKNEKIILSIIK